MKVHRPSQAAGIVLCAFLSACTHQEPQFHPARKTASQNEQPPPELGEQWTSDNEAQSDEIVSISEQMLVKRSEGSTFLRRDAHPKHHGCVKASVKVDSSRLPADLRVGIFAPEARAENPAWIRFSNGSPDGATKPDIDKDIRGMAVKLMNVTGAKEGSQDFVMLTSKEFFSKDGADYLELHHALSDGSLSVIWYLITHGTTRKILLGGQIRSPNPLQVEYFSSVPYKLGSRSMKFKARPCASDDFHDQVPDGKPASDYLRQRLVDTLQTKSACFEFLVEPNMNPEVQPVEDPTIAWDEGASPYIKVATITIPAQKDIDSEEHLNFCENLSFSPWHTRPETRPLGQINRMRLQIYPAISEFRHRFNHIPMIEPRSQEICAGETAPLCQTPKH